VARHVTDRCSRGRRAGERAERAEFGCRNPWPTGQQERSCRSTSFGDQRSERVTVIGQRGGSRGRGKESGSARRGEWSGGGAAAELDRALVRAAVRGAGIAFRSENRLLTLRGYCRSLPLPRNRLISPSFFPFIYHSGPATVHAEVVPEYG